MREKAQRAESIVHCDNDDALPGQLGGVVIAAGAVGKATTVDPHEHGQILSVITSAQLGGRHVQVQAVFVPGPQCERVRLRTAGREYGCVADALPTDWWLWRPPAQIPSRRSGVRQA